MQIKKILFPTDFSENASNCLPFLRDVAHRTGASVYLFHVFHHRMLDPSIPPHKFEDKAREKQDNAKSRLTSLCQELTTHEDYPVKHCEKEVRVGFADDEIVNVIEEADIDLVIMGTKGATGIKKVMLGSVTSEIIEEAKCPVIAIPEDAKHVGFSQIVFATDLELSDIPLIKKASAFAELYGAGLTVLHIGQKEYEAIKDSLEEFETELKLKAPYEHLKFRYMRHNKKVEGIDLFLQDSKAELLAMVSHKRSLFKGLFKRSLTSQIAHQARIPLLAFHESDDAVNE